MSDIRQHGLQLPLSAHQIGSFIGVGYTTVVFLLILRPSSLQHAIFFGILAVGFCTFLVTVLIDPRLTPDKAPNDANRFCNSCELTMDMNTKHCRICNKCIYRFDHHCLYLNTCIGGRNYRPFFALVTLTALWLAIYLTLTLIAISKGINDPDLHEDNMYGSMLVYLVVLGSLSLVPLLMFLSVASLWLFHIYIGFLRVSTYDWIVGKRDAESIEMPAYQSERQQEEIQARRQEIYEQWVRQNRLRQQQQQQQKLLPFPSSGDNHTPMDRPAAVPGPDVKIELNAPAPASEVPRSNSESILSQVEEVLGIDINVNEGRPRYSFEREPDALRPESAPANVDCDASSKDPAR